MSEPKLEICSKCGRHAHVTLAHGFLGPEFCFQDHGFHMLSIGLAYEPFTQEEALRLNEALQASGLPVSVRDVEAEFAWKIEIWNALRESEWIDENVHDFLQMPASEKMPDDFVAVVEENLKSTIQ